MAVRSREQLRRDQVKLLEAYRSGRAQSGAVRSTESESAIACRIGKITSVVTSDETHGAHVVVKPQVFKGRPPVPSDSTVPTRIAYPTPSLSVGDYQVDEYVALWIADGAELAVKL